MAVMLLLILIVFTLILNSLLSYRNSSELILIRNDSLIRAFDEFRLTWKERDPSLSAIREERDPVRNHPSASVYGEEAVTAGRSADPDSIRSDGRSDTRYQPFSASEKLNTGETISLNETDTTRWKMIPGIGSSYASRIVKYRELLGGYVRKEQLMEVYGVDAELYARISPYIEPDSLCVRLQVNRAEFRELLRHPYLNYKQVQAIVNLRRRKGDLVSLNELAMLDEFTSDDIWRLEPYLAF